MGNNALYNAFEALTIAAYNKDVLDAELLEEFCKPFRDTDADPGDAGTLLAKDGLDIYQVIVKTAGQELPVKPILPPKPQTWTDDQHAANEEYFDTLFGMVSKITGF